MKKLLTSAALLALASGLVACDEYPDEPTPEQLEELTDAELLSADELIDPNAPEPEDEGPVHPAANSLRAESDVQGANPEAVPWTISPGTTCLNNSQCPSGMRCDPVAIPDATVAFCVGSCNTDADCQEGEACGGDGFCDVLLKGDWDFCKNGGCMRGHGDCDVDADCTGNLTCIQNNGAEWGYGSTRDVCDYPPGHANYCSNTHPCGAGEGDCDTGWGKHECGFGLWCNQDRGPLYGFASWVDVCEVFPVF